MIPDNRTPRPQAAMTTSVSAPEGSYVDWAAILAGGVFALAVSFLLISFGTGLGLSMSSLDRGEGMSAVWLAIAAGIWFAWVMVTGFGAGGYIAGRMRRKAGDATAPEIEVRDGVHGLLVWATGAVVGAILGTLGVGGLLTAGASVAGQAVEVASDVAGADYFADVMLRDGAVMPQATAAEPAPAGTAALPAAQQRPAGISATDPSIQRQVVGILARSAAEGEMAERDRAYLAQLVAANTDLDETAARARVDEVIAEIDEARSAAMAAVERARVAGIIFGFIAAATLLVGAVAAFLAAAAGGRHRDQGLGWTY